MKLILKNFLSTLRRYKTSSILNILGLSVAFAALYIILVQVHYDLTYNQNIKDSERIYRIETPDWDEAGKFMCWISRPLAEKSTEGISCVESVGTGYFQGGINEMCTERDGTLKELSFRSSSASMPFFKIFGFETVQGNLDELEDTKKVAVSTSAAKKFNLKIGDILYYGVEKKTGKCRSYCCPFQRFPGQYRSGNH